MRRRQGFVAVADQQHHVRLQSLELAGELHHAEAHRLGHRGRRRAFELDVDFAVDVKAVLAHDAHRLVEALQHHRAGGQHLQLQAGWALDRAHHRLQPAVVGAVDQHHADLSWFGSQSRSSSERKVSAATALLAACGRRYRPAGPRECRCRASSVPGRLARADGRPAGRWHDDALAEQRLRSAISAATARPCRARVAMAASMKRDTLQPAFQLAGGQRCRHVGPKTLPREHDVNFQQVGAQRHRRKARQ